MVRARWVDRLVSFGGAVSALDDDLLARSSLLAACRAGVAAGLVSVVVSPTVDNTLMRRLCDPEILSGGVRAAVAEVGGLAGVRCRPAGSVVWHVLGYFDPARLSCGVHGWDVGSVQCVDLAAPGAVIAWVGAAGVDPGDPVSWGYLTSKYLLRDRPAGYRLDLDLLVQLSGGY